MARRFALILGIIFVVVGILGFFPGLTPGHRLFGLLMVNGAHNWVHLLTGILGILASRSPDDAPAIGYAWFVLVVYGLVSLLGFIVAPHGGMLLGFLMVNRADNWLHLLVTLSALAVVVSEQRRTVFRV